MGIVYALLRYCLLHLLPFLSPTLLLWLLPPLLLQLQRSSLRLGRHP